MIRKILLGVSLMTIPLMSHAQDSSPVELKNPNRADNSAEFLDSYRKNINKTTDDLKKAGRGQNLTPLINILKNEKAFSRTNARPGLGLSDEEHRDLMITQTAQSLAINGIRPNQLNNLKKAGYDPVRGYERISSNGVTLQDAMAFTSHPILGSIASASLSSDGVLVNIAVEEAFGKFNKLSGSVSIEVPKHHAILDLEVGDKCVFFLSQDRNQFRKQSGYSYSAGSASEIFFPYCNQDGTFKAMHISYASKTASLEEIRTAAQVIEKRNGNTKKKK